MVCVLVSLLRRADDYGGSAVASLLKVSTPHILADQWVELGVEVLISGVHARLGGQLVIGLAGDGGQGIQRGGPAAVNGQRRHKGVHVLGADIVLFDVIVQPGLGVEGKGAAGEQGIIPGQGGAQRLMEDGVGAEAALGEHAGGIGDGVGHLDATAQHHVILPGGH